MSEQIKLTDGELNEVRVILDGFQKKTFQLGQLYIQKIKTEKTLKSLLEHEKKLTEDLESIEKSENILIDKLLSKYGEGSLDLQSGTFVVDKKPTPTS